MACCKSCAGIGQRKKRKSMARKKLKIQDSLMSGAGVATGIVAGKFVTAQISNAAPQIGGSPLLKGGVQILVGALVSSRAKKGSFLDHMSMGMSANGAVDLFKGIAGPDMANQIGLTGLGAGVGMTALPGGSYTMPGVAGRVNGLNAYDMKMNY